MKLRISQPLSRFKALAAEWRIWPAGLGLLLAVAFLAAAGCSTTPASASFASVTITNKTTAAIQTTAAQVFRENGYSGGGNGDTMLFQKEGSVGNNIAYNGVVGAHYGAKTVVRVKGQIVDLTGGMMRLQCQAYMVRNAGDSFFEEESRVSKLRNGPYQDLLDEVGKRLQ